MRFLFFHIDIKAFNCRKSWTRSIAVFCLFISSYAYSQSCNCPSTTSCAPCQGGLTSITLRYDGLIPALITAADTRTLLFISVVAPGQTFTLEGNDPAGRFVGGKLTFTVGLIQDVSINTSCNSSLYINTIFG